MYPTNDRGLTYGEQEFPGHEPDLVRTRTDGGDAEGYAYCEELHRANQVGGSVPVYESDGVTRLGYWTVVRP